MSTPVSETTPPPEGHPIQVVSRRTGLSPEVLRMWEKRYGAVSPARTGSGRRLYSEGDIEKLRLLKEATGSGRRIGEVARLPAGVLADLVREDRRAEESAPARHKEVAAAGAGAFVEGALHAMEAYDERALNALLERAAYQLDLCAFTDEFLAPLMDRIGQAWHEGRLTPAQEHMTSHVVLHLLGRMTSATSASREADAIVVTTPARQRHEIGALLAAAAAASEGWRVTYLGADLPAAEIARAAEVRKARAVALSIVFPADDPGLEAELRELRARLPRETAIFAGGASAGRYAAALRQAGAIQLDSLAEFRAALRAMASNREGRR